MRSDSATPISSILQPFDAGGRLGLIVYMSNGGGYAAVFGSGDMGQGSGALTWLTGIVSRGGRALNEPELRPNLLRVVTSSRAADGRSREI
jgi:hypothetical protein